MKRDQAGRPLRSFLPWLLWGGVLLLVVLITVAFLVLPRSSGMSLDAMTAVSYPDQAELSLPISCRTSTRSDGVFYMYGGDYYTFSGPFQALVSEAVELCGEENVELLPGDGQVSSLLIRQAGGDGAAQFYLLEEMEEGRVLFYGMAAALLGEDSSSEMLLLPFHLIDDARISHLPDPALYLDAEYQLSLPSGAADARPEELLELAREQFLRFYGESSYSVEPVELGLTLTAGEDSWRITFAVHSGRPFFRVSRA